MHLQASCAMEVSRSHPACVLSLHCFHAESSSLASFVELLRAQSASASPFPLCFGPPPRHRTTRRTRVTCCLLQVPNGIFTCAASFGNVHGVCELTLVATTTLFCVSDVLVPYFCVRRVGVRASCLVLVVSCELLTFSLLQMPPATSTFSRLSSTTRRSTSQRRSVRALEFRQLTQASAAASVLVVWSSVWSCPCLDWH